MRPGAWLSLECGEQARIVVQRLPARPLPIAVGVGPFFDPHALDSPIGHPLAVEPIVEELFPRASRISLQLVLEIADAQDAVLILGVDQAHEVEEAFFAQAGLDHADDLAAAVVGHRHQPHEILEAGHLLHRRRRFAAGERAHQRRVAVVVAMNVGEPFQRGRQRNQRVVAAVLHVHQPVREVDRQAFVHPGLGIAVDADDVEPPLVADLVRDQLVDEVAGAMRQPEDPRVDHHQAAALVAVPAEVRLADGEVRVRVRPKPPLVRLEGLGRDPDHLLRVELVPGQREAMQADRPNLAHAFLVAGAAGQAEVPHARSADFDQLAAVSQLALADDRARARQLLVEWQIDVGRVDAGFVEEGLVPGDEGRRLPALLVVEGQHGQPLRQKGDAFPLSPTSLALRQSQRERDLDGDVLALVDLTRQGDFEGRVVVRAIAKRQFNRCGRGVVCVLTHQTDVLDR